MKHIITINDYTKEIVGKILTRAAQLKKNGFEPTLQNKLAATLFYEPSTRTRLSFETAVLRAHGRVISAGDTHLMSVAKGETLEDTIRVISGYVDAIVMRHPEAGSAARAAAVSRVPIINAGDGAHAHPTQTLLDLFTIQEVLSRLDHFSIAMVGDLKYSRVYHSLAQVLTWYTDVKQYWISPAQLSMPDDIRTYVREHGGNIVELNDYHDIISDVDVLIMTRVQQERFTDRTEYERLKGACILQPQDLKNAKSTLKVLSPLPRTVELPISMDETPHAYYFQQAANGVPVRTALLEYVFDLL